MLLMFSHAPFTVSCLSAISRGCMFILDFRPSSAFLVCVHIATMLEMHGRKEREKHMFESVLHKVSSANEQQSITKLQVCVIIFCERTEHLVRSLFASSH